MVILSGQYWDVIHEFLTKNKDIPNGHRWLENQKWHEDIKKYASLIENNIILSEEDIRDLKRVMFDCKEYRSHGGENIHYQKLYELVLKRDYIIDYFKENYKSDANIEKFLKDRFIFLQLCNVENYDDLEKALIGIYKLYKESYLQ